MKERLLQLLDLEHLTPSKFADLIGVQRSSVSHILSDRNKPSFDFLHKTLKTFPGLKADWLMLGEGPMYDQMGREPGNLFNQAPVLPPVNVPQEIQDQSKAGIKEQEEFTSEDADNESVKDYRRNEARKVVKVMLFFDDDTFHTYEPSQ